nr:ATP synthase F0 subunit 8 [Borysthenes sp. 1 WQW-2023a]
MPQMSPMSWTLIMILTTCTMTMMKSTNYFEKF